MSRAQQDETAILPKLIQMGLAGAAGNIVTQHIAEPFLDGNVPASGAIDATNASADLNGAELHSGPAEGGTMLDRPVAGYLADQATSNGLDLEYTHDSVSEVASSIDQAGTMTINGQTINVLEYAPGGDLVRAASGAELSASDALGMVGQLAITTGSLSREAGQGVLASGPGHLLSEMHGKDQDPFGLGDSSDGQGKAAAEINKTDSPVRQQLELEHRLALQAALQTSDETQVETEVHAGDKTLKIKTNFEARLPDNAKEQKEGEEHLQEVMRLPGNDIQKAHDHFRMRSIIEAQDSGLGLTL